MTQMDIPNEKVELAKAKAKSHPILKHYSMTNSTAVVNKILDFFIMGHMTDTKESVQIPHDKIDKYIIFPKEKLETLIREKVKDEIDKTN